MEGDHYCQDLGLGLDGEQCFQVLQNGNRIMLFDLNGYAALQLQAVQREEQVKKIQPAPVDSAWC
jgi:hypothetical protein